MGKLLLAMWHDFFFISSIYIYKTEAFEALTIFHVSTILKK